MPDVALYGLLGLVFFQAYVTIRVVRDATQTPAKKRRQLLLVWLVPFVGAALALAELEARR